MIPNRRASEQAHLTRPAGLSLGLESERLMRTGKLAGIVAGAVLVLVLAISLLGGTDYASADRSYFTRVAAPAADSQSIGHSFEQDLVRSGSTRSALAAEVAHLLQRQQADDAALESLTPPPRL